MRRNPHRRPDTLSRFNPHPASLPGDAPYRPLSRCKQPVSIRTRHRCRVMRMLPAPWSLLRCFNPHPASLPGDAVDTSGKVGIVLVSIRTRHRCRVMHPWAAVAPPIESFNPHPASLPGDAVNDQVGRRRHAMFQSAPGIAAG